MASPLTVFCHDTHDDTMPVKPHNATSDVAHAPVTQL
jgi:hypothetical protein